MSAVRKKPGRKKRPLNLRERKFLRNLLIGMTGARAAREAGYKAETARQTAYELMTKPYIREAYDAELRKISISGEEIIREYEIIAKEITVRDCWTDDGRLLIPPQMSDIANRAIKKFEADPITKRVHIEMHSKTDALNALAKIKRMLVDRKEVTGANGSPLFDVEQWRKMVNDA